MSPPAMAYFGPLPHLKTAELSQNFSIIYYIQFQETVTKMFYNKPKKGFKMCYL